MKRLLSGHVPSDHLGEAALHGGPEALRPAERTHFEGCEQCRRLYAGYCLTDRLLAAPWRQTALPPAAVAGATSRRGLAGRLGFGFGLGFRPGSGRLGAGLGSRALVPVALAIALAVLVGFGVLLPRLMPLPSPAADHSPSAVPTGTPSAAIPSGISTISSPGVTQSAGTGAAGTQGISGPTPPPATAGPIVPIGSTGLPGWPVQWAPDGKHLLVASGGRGGRTQILDTSGHQTGSFSADGATWFDSQTIATTATAAGSSRGPGHPGSDASATITLVNLSGHVTATLSGQYRRGGQMPSSAQVAGSGTGLVAISSRSGWGLSQASFVIWDGKSVGPAHDGVPLIFSRDGGKLAVLHPISGTGGSTGWLEVISTNGLGTLVSHPHTALRLPSLGAGPGYAPDASFSPDGNSLFDSGTLVDLGRGSAVRVGEGGWLPDGTLLTSSGGSILRWQGSRSSPDTRFLSGGAITTSRRGEVVEYFGDGRTPLLLTPAGNVRQFVLSGFASIQGAQLAPDGASIAIAGRGSNGSVVTSLARLR